MSWLAAKDVTVGMRVRRRQGVVLTVTEVSSHLAPNIGTRFLVVTGDGVACSSSPDYLYNVVEEET